MYEDYRVAFLRSAVSSFNAEWCIDGRGIWIPVIQLMELHISVSFFSRSLCCSRVSFISHELLFPVSHDHEIAPLRESDSGGIACTLILTSHPCFQCLRYCPFVLYTLQSMQRPLGALAARPLLTGLWGAWGRGTRNWLRPDSVWITYPQLR